MSDQFWLSFGYICGAAMKTEGVLGKLSIAALAANADPAIRGEVERHIKAVMVELLDHFPDEMRPLKRYIE